LKESSRECSGRNPVLLFFAAGVGLGRFHQIRSTRKNNAIADLIVFLAAMNFVFTYLGFYQILPGFWASFLIVDFINRFNLAQ
jgi:hypothetical protein